MVTYHRVQVEDCKGQSVRTVVFYREAGNPENPERITAIISQNGNMYEEGLGKKWEARKAYWANPTPELRQQFSSAFALETIIGQYTFGTPEGSVGPDGYSLDYYYVNLPDDWKCPRCKQPKSKFNPA